MTWLFAILLVLLIGGIVVVAAGHGEGLPPVDAEDELALPTDRPIGADDLRSVRFNTALPGYRMSEVDELLRRLGTQLELGETDGQDSHRTGRDGTPVAEQHAGDARVGVDTDPDASPDASPALAGDRHVGQGPTDPGLQDR